ncbi:MAG: RHS repeat-associated core domain-containing protein [Cyclobacteriaceae bacterium]
MEVIKSPVSALSDYYPFGMLQAGNSTNSGDPVGNKYLYNGKELEEDLGLQWYDYGARMYQADVGRWFAVDNKSEKFMHMDTHQIIQFII